MINQTGMLSINIVLIESLEKPHTLSDWQNRALNSQGKRFACLSVSALLEEFYLEPEMVPSPASYMELQNDIEPFFW